MSLRSLLPPPPGPEARQTRKAEAKNRDFWENPNISTPEELTAGTQKIGGLENDFPLKKGMIFIVQPLVFEGVSSVYGIM